MANAYKYDKVMVIDDNPVDRLIAQKALKAYGFAQSIIIMEGARVALDHLLALQNDTANIPELIFVDLSMPVLGGLDFLKEYEHLPENVRRKNIVILTSSLNTSDRVQALSSPYVIKFLNKPLNASILNSV